MIFSRVSKAVAIFRTLLTSRTVKCVSFTLPAWPLVSFKLGQLTAWENHPDEVHEEIVEPKVKELWTAIGNLFVVVVEHAGGIIEDEAVNLSNANDDLKGMA